MLDSGQDTVTDKICRIIVGGDFRCHLPLKMSSMEFGRRAQQIGVSNVHWGGACVAKSFASAKILHHIARL